jgi:regulator of protease activity HflC (stomatin/prohibitin superfamily)
MKKQMLSIIAILTLGFTMTSCYDFNRDQAEKDAESKGKQTLLEAESSKKAKIEEAKADLESAKLNAESVEINAKADAKKKFIEAEARAKSLEIEARAKAEAIKVMSKELENNPNYLKFKQIESISRSKTVFVPTEGNMPILMQNN